MATHIEHHEIEILPILPYKELRATLKSGDILFASKGHHVTKKVRNKTKSPWSHMGIVFRLDSLDRLLLLESVEDVGVCFTPLSKYLTDYEGGKPYQGRVVLARCTDVKAKNITDIALGISKKEGGREYLCSELVYECFACAGKAFRYNPEGFISPEDIWLDEQLFLLGRIL